MMGGDGDGDGDGDGHRDGDGGGGALSVVFYLYGWNCVTCPAVNWE